MPSTTPATAAISALSLHDALPIFPRYARLSVAGGGATVKPPVRVADCPFGFVTTTSRGPSVAVDPIVSATVSCVAATTVVDPTVIPAPNAALAPAWLLAPATGTVGLVRGAPVLGCTLVLVGITGTVTVALAVVPSAKFAVIVKTAPLLNGAEQIGRASCRKRPSVTAKLTAP